MTRMIRLLCLSLLAAAAVACGDDPPAPAPIEMRTYAVPPALASEVRGVVDRLLTWGDDQPRLGRAALGPGGTLVVSATPSVHAGVAQLVAGLDAAPPPAPAGVELTYWLVEGRSGEGDDDAALAVVGPALAAIEAADGARAFRLVETLRLRTLAGERGEIEGRRVRIHQAASVRDGEVLAELELKHRGGGLRTHLALPVDTLLVLGQSGAADDAGVEVGDLYYLVRARVAPAAK